MSKVIKGLPIFVVLILIGRHAAEEQVLKEHKITGIDSFQNVLTFFPLILAMAE